MLLFITLQGSNIASSLLFPIIMIALMYFFFLRPQAKKNKEQNDFAANLKKGDEVVTASGIIGQISKIDANI